MKFPLICWTILMLCSGCQNSSKQSTTDSPDTESQSSNNHINREISLRPEILPDSVVVFKFKLSDTLFFDFNCDDAIDEAFFRKSDKGINLIIKDTKVKEISIGADSTFQLIGNNFDWVDTWGATADSSTYEVLFKDGEISGSKKVTLNCFSIVLRKEEEGGGIITFKNGRYQWIHQAD